MAGRRRQHWMSEIVDSLRERITDAIPAVADGVKGEVPFGYKPPKPDDEVRAFLNMAPEQRQQLFQQLGPDGYRDWSTSMMKKLNTRFGPAAQMLYPMLEGAPIEALASAEPLDEGSMGVQAAQADLTELLGFDPFS